MNIEKFYEEIEKHLLDEFGKAAGALNELGLFQDNPEVQACIETMNVSVLRVAISLQ